MNTYEIRFSSYTVSSDWDGDFRSREYIATARVAVRSNAARHKVAEEIRAGISPVAGLLETEIFRVTDGKAHRCSVTEEYFAKRARRF